MKLRLSALALVGVSIFGWTTAAQDLPAPVDGDVLDLAQVLDATAEARIARLLVESEDSTGVPMVVVTMTDIASHGGSGERMEAYAARLLQAWEIGEPEKNDGILILVTTEPAEARIALGAGYPPVYNERAARVLGLAVLPALREGRIAEGIEAGVISARDNLIAPFLTGAPVTAGEGFQTARPELPASLPYILLGLGLVGTAAFLALRKARLQKTCPSCETRALTRTFEVIEPPTALSEGSAIEHLLCKSCGFTDRQVFALRPKLGGGYRRKLGK